MVQAVLGIHLTHRTNARKNGRAILGMQRIVTQPKAKLFYPEMIFLHTHRLRHTHTYICSMRMYSGTSCENLLKKMKNT